LRKFLCCVAEKISMMSELIRYYWKNVDPLTDCAEMAGMEKLMGFGPTDVTAILADPHREAGHARSSGDGAKSGIQSVQRAFAILDVIAQTGGEASLTEISRLTGLKISTCHHLLATLIHCGYAAKRRGARSYVLGSRILGLSAFCLKQVNLPQQAQRVIEMLNVRTQEAVQLAVLQGDDIVTVMRRETLSAVRVDTGGVGKIGAAHATATGKAILAWLPQAELSRLIEVKGLPAFTANTITDFAKLVEELRLVRRLGYAMDREEFQVGVCCVGAAIRSPTGTVLGSLSVSTPVFRTDEKILESIRAQVIAAAQVLAADLSGSNTA
jgi:IclR family acetate operon transcriptional repressor